MQLTFITRGMKWDVDRFINDLGHQKLPYKYKGKDALIQTAIRPYQIWEVAFPKEYQELMLNTVLREGTPKDKYSKQQKFLWLLQKALGLKKIPEFNPDDKRIPVWRAHTDFIGVGIKEDEEHEFGEGL